MIDFAEVELQVRQLKEQAEAGEIDPGALEARLMELVDVGPDGYYWMYGHQTGQWFRHDGEQWLPGNPPGHHPEVAPDWSAVDLGWFFLGLVALAVIAGIIYSSAAAI
ncbi:MAG: hypothetical protein Kow0031_07140 [Anaerolineae bacterium]